MLNRTAKWLPVTNTVAQFASSTVTKEKGFITLKSDDLDADEGPTDQHEAVASYASNEPGKDSSLYQSKDY